MPIKVFKINPEFVDERGYISRIIDQKKIQITSILYIKSKAGSERGNHYHKKDFHYVYCLSGKFIYSEKNVKKPNSKIESVELLPGDLVLTKPYFAHSMKFLEDSVFLALTTETRNQSHYEKDTKRIKLS